MTTQATLIEDAAKVTPEERPVIVDRSTIEPYIDCPLGARLKQDLVKSVGIIAASGNESHKAISSSINDYIQAMISPDTIPFGVRELRERMSIYLDASRADVQPDVIDSMKYSLYKIADYIAGGDGVPHHTNILAFDGGEDIFVKQAKKDELGNVATSEEGYPIMESRCLSGQLDLKFDECYGRRSVIATCEVDLLHSTHTPGLLRLVDWKTGYANHTEASIATDFQLGCFYPLLVLKTYPDAIAVDVVVCNTRKARWTMPVRFFQSDVDRMERRVKTAIQAYMLNRNKPLEQVAATPSREACRLCDAAALCSVCDEDIREIKKDPVAATDKLYTLTRAIEEIEATLKTCCKGGDIVTPSGNAFGYCKAKRETKPKPVFYQDKSASSDDEDS